MLLFALPEQRSSVTHSYHTCSQITVISCGSTWTELCCWHECKVYHNVMTLVKHNFGIPIWVVITEVQFLVDCVKCDGTRAETRFVFRRNGRVHLNRRGRQLGRLLASAVVMLDTPCSEVVWRVLVPTPFASFPFTSPPCVTVCHHISTELYCTYCQCPAAPPWGHPASGYVTATFHCTMNSPYTLSFFRCYPSLPQTCLANLIQSTSGHFYKKWERKLKVSVQP